MCLDSGAKSRQRVSDILNRKEWESKCDCGRCSDCELAYELSERGLVAFFDDTQSLPTERSVSTRYHDELMQLALNEKVKLETDNKRLSDAIFHLDKCSNRAEVYRSLLEDKAEEDACLVMSEIERIYEERRIGEKPTCPKCGESDKMYNHGKGWVCHHTHRLAKSTESEE